MRCCRVSGVPKKDYLPLLTYRVRLASGLIQYGGAAAVSRHSPRIQFPLQTSKSDDSSEEEQDESQVKRSRKVVPQAVPEVRFDGVGHLPEYKNDSFASKCRYPSCKSRSRIMCAKCKLYLCVMKNNCFSKYHIKWKIDPVSYISQFILVIT